MNYFSFSKKVISSSRPKPPIRETSTLFDDNKRQKRPRIEDERQEEDFRFEELFAMHFFYFHKDFFPELKETKINKVKKRLERLYIKNKTLTNEDVENELEKARRQFIKQKKLSNKENQFMA